MKKQKLFLILAIGLLNIIFSSQSQAGTLTVTTTTDELDATSSSTGCSLREAIQNINDHTAGSSITYTECGTPNGTDDTIVLQSGENYRITLSETSEEDNNVTGDFDIKGDVTIEADGSTAASVSGSNFYRIFDVHKLSTGAHATFNHLELISGMSSDQGGCLYIAIHNSATIQNSTITNCTVSGSSNQTGGAIYGNHATLNIENSTITMSTITPTSSTTQALGGGLYLIDSTLTLSNSTISSNTARNSSGGPGFGGGLYLDNATATITRSAFDTNTAEGNCAQGGGILSNGYSNLTIHNSTFLQNIAHDSTSPCGAAGGALYLDSSGTAKLNHVTISNNEVRVTTATSTGGGITNAGSTNKLNIKNSIIANNRTGTTNDDIVGSFVSYGYNIVENHSSGIITYGSGADSSTHDTSDPILNSSGAYGGDTTTFSFSSGSPAEDSGNCTDIDGAAVTIDQRGFLRDDGDSLCDIGAFELIEHETGAMCEDGIDNDSDGQSDCLDLSDCSCSTWYTDADGDGFGDSSDSGTMSYTQPESTTDNNNDCDDSDATILGPMDYYPDTDGDGYGDSYYPPISSCTGGPGSSTNNEDCDDSRAEYHSEENWYIDVDGDGYGDASATAVVSCGHPALLDDYIRNNSDCHDSSNTAHPGITSENSEESYCSDGIDNDCDGSIDSSDSDCTSAVSIDEPTIEVDTPETTPVTTEGESETTTETVSGAKSEASPSGGCQLNPAQPISQTTVLVILMGLLGLVRLRDKTSHN